MPEAKALVITSAALRRVNGQQQSTTSRMGRKGEPHGTRFTQMFQMRDAAGDLREHQHRNRRRPRRTKPQEIVTELFRPSHSWSETRLAKDNNGSMGLVEAADQSQNVALQRLDAIW
jgi:hypothetical protein